VLFIEDGFILSTMVSLCTRCALRLQRAANSTTTTQYSRSLSTNPQAFIRGLPSFQPTSNPELDALLTDFRYKHFLPAALEKPQWDLVFRNKNRNFLKENPQSVSIGTEVFELQYLGGYGVMPNRKEQLSRVLDLMRKGEADDWNNLPNLLRGLHAMGKDPPPRVRARMIRQASVSGRFDIVMKCLRAAQTTGLTLKDADTLHATIWGLRSIADQDDWGEDALGQALKYSNDVASLLESEVHGGGRNVPATDARRSPFVLGVFLELHAVYAYRFKKGEDINGRVNVFAERLLFNIPEAEMEVSPQQTPSWQAQH
jgi:hypothetical protein